MNYPPRTREASRGRFKNLKNRAPRGYALLLVMFFLALLALSVASVSPDILTQGRREKEAEMVWRGKQYERGIKLFYRRNHRIPVSIEELTAQNLGLRFMRKAYKDPMNDLDGSWRLIYVGPSGQLIGSTRPNLVFQLAAPGMNTGSTQNDATSQSGRSVFRSQDSGDGFGTPAGGIASATNTTAPAATPDSGQIFGGAIIGVGSKVNRNSIRWLDGAKNYLQFEFIWDPSKEGMGVNPIKLLTAPPVNSALPSQTSSSGQPNGLGTGPQIPSNPQ